MIICQADARHVPLPDGIADLVIIDPPYAILKYESLTRGMAKPITRYMEWDNLTTREWYWLIRDAMREVYRICRDGATVYCFCAGEYMMLARIAGERAGLLWHLPNYWHKTNPAPKIYLTTPQSSVEVFGMFTKGKGQTFNAENGGLCHNFFEYPMPTGNGRVHQTQKPLGLLIDLIERSSNAGDRVVDTFCGSGVTGQAAKMLGRRYFCSDANFEYARDMAAFKIEKHASGKAVAGLPLFEMAERKMR